ncbi:hypothetical protein SG34_030575 [Thalassomonas viridans]|uniref:Uncharacterized protein n=1 Tax=Thalassomonas viridans TaxID=137584 RepID=A0AAE9ZAV7_9GAMM|nr:hypothetical protein [Thalassomonas viridans]WDE09114.1 hypothetical protein SG34_030575 [Thalassomonas viridans]
MSNTLKESDKKREENEIVGLLPPIKSMVCFLVVTVLLALGTAFTGSTVLSKYFNFTPEWLLGSLAFIGIIFCIINFRVTRGSFLCAKILQYYTLFLAAACLPAFVIVEEPYYPFYFINIFLMLITFYLISSKTYWKLVQYQHDHFADIKEAREEVEKILNAKAKQ